MGQIILHKDGAYQLYTTVGEGACFESALTLEQLTAYIKEELGERGLHDLPDRLRRAHRHGSSSHILPTLEDTIACNRAGPGETHMSVDEFVAKYLTLLPTEAPPA